MTQEKSGKHTEEEGREEGDDTGTSPDVEAIATYRAWHARVMVPRNLSAPKENSLPEL